MFDISSCHSDGHNCYLRETYGYIEQVAQFIQQYYPFDEVDSRIRQYIAIINCEVNGGNGCIDACCIPENQQTILIFGRYPQATNPYHSLAILLDVVAHEFCHGLIFELFKKNKRGANELGKSNPTTDAEREESALEESFCDLFAILVRNQSTSSISDWDWQIGHIPEINMNYVERNLAKRASYYDYHDFSRIHSHAFFLLMQSPIGNHQFAVQLFFDTLLELRDRKQKLQEQKPPCNLSFAVSGQAMLEATNKMYQLPETAIIHEHIRNAFDEVGIVLE